MLSVRLFVTFFCRDIVMDLRFEDKDNDFFLEDNNTAF